MSRPPAAPELAITFPYHSDLDRALDFYSGVMGFTPVVDQGWAKIPRVAHGAHLGLVDQSRGRKRATPDKPVQFCIRVPDVDAWHEHAAAHDVANLSRLFDNETLGIRAFVFDDPEGYQIEVQSATRTGA